MTGLKEHNSRSPISVLIPAHRVDDYFFQSLSSILATKSTEDEVLVVLNGQAISKAEQLQALYKEDSKVRFLISEKPGIVSALNLGLGESSYEFIARMDADDITLPGRFDAQVDFLERHQDFSVIGTQMRYICPHGTSLNRTHFPRNSKIGRPKPLVPPVGHPSVMFRKSAVLEIGGYRNHFPHVEDHDLWTRLQNTTRIGSLKEIYLKYRLHANQISRINSNTQATSGFQVLLSDALKIHAGLDDEKCLALAKNITLQWSNDENQELPAVPNEIRRMLMTQFRAIRVPITFESWADKGGIRALISRENRLPQLHNLAIIVRTPISSTSYLFKVMISALLKPIYLSTTCAQCALES